MKEETIEEAAEEYGYKVDELLGKQLAIECFMSGANWQKEQDSKVMYTEEEVLDLFKSYASDNQFKMNVALLSPEFWFNENKK